MDFEEVVTDWLDKLQLRVPGSTVLLVATHIDCTTKEDVDRQCRSVQHTVREHLKASEVFRQPNIAGLKARSVTHPHMV